MKTENLIILCILVFAIVAVTSASYVGGKRADASVELGRIILNIALVEKHEENKKGFCEAYQSWVENNSYTGPDLMPICVPQSPTTQPK